MYNCEFCNIEHDGTYGSGRFCSQKCARAFSTQSKREQINEKVSNALKGTRKSVTRPIKERFCKVCGKKLPIGTRSNKSTCSIECSKTLRSQVSKELYNQNKDNLHNNGFRGGYRKGAARGKSGYYKGIWCDSTYELVYLIYNLDNGIDIRRNTLKFPYSHNGKNHEYIPDFRVNGELVEIKNFWTEVVQVKLECVPEKISILYYDELEEMMQFVDEKYGTWHKKKKNNYEVLYDK